MGEKNNFTQNITGAIILTNKNRLYAINAFVFLFYILLASFANWSLLTGNNFMKWDIADAHFPNSVFLADSLRAGIFPLWNPSMSFGSPHYAMIGTPTYYFTTFILAVFGYHPRFMGVEYIFHIAVGCFGAYLLINKVLGKQAESSFVKVCITFAGGFLYGFSTVFVSNGQHIMIVISAAWIPYVIYFNYRYIYEKKIICLLLAGLTASFIITGGYPEIFVYLFIILAFFNMYHVISKDMRILSGLFVAIRNVFFVGLFSLLAAAYLIIPFIISAPRVCRVTLTYVLPPHLFQFESLLSSLIPGITRYIRPGEVSMSYMYVGLITLLCIPLVSRHFKKDVVFYVILVFFSFFMLFGIRTPIFSFLYRFLPFLESMRFSSLWRVMFALFSITVACKIWYAFFQNDNEEETNIQLKAIKAVSVGTTLLLVILHVLLIISACSTSDMKRALITQVLMFLFFLLLYGLCFVLKKNKTVSKVGIVAIFTIVVLIEGLTYQFQEAPLTLLRFAPNDVQFDPQARLEVQRFVTAYRTRNTSIEFKDAVRTSSGLDSRGIVFGKTLDEMGYVSFTLARTQNYNTTINRIIIAQNPVLYFTNNVVSPPQVNFDTWSHDISVPPAQIFVGSPNRIDTENPMFRVGDSGDIHIVNLEIMEESELYHINGTMFPAGRDQYRFARVFVQTEEERIDMTVSYVQGGEFSRSHDGSFVVNRDGGKSFIDIFYPDYYEKYDGLKIEVCESFIVSSATFHVAQRMNQANHVVVESFTPNEIRVLVDAPEEGYLVILQNYYPGWRAYIEGVQSNITLVNETFMGIQVDEGISNVVLRFTPVDFYIGLLISGLFMIVLITIIVYTIKISSKGHKKDKKE